MAIIMIYEGIHGAEEVANRVAKSLDYKCVGRQDLAATLPNYGVPRAKLDDITEKAPHWWEQWLQDLRPYRIALQAAMCEMAQAGPMVYHGHVGHELLPGVSHVLKVFLTGSMDLRIDLLRSHPAQDEGAIRRQLEHADRARSRRLIRRRPDPLHVLPQVRLLSVGFSRIVKPYCTLRCVVSGSILQSKKDKVILRCPQNNILFQVLSSYWPAQFLMEVLTNKQRSNSSEKKSRPNARADFAFHFVGVN